MTAQETSSITSTAIQQICIGLDLSRCKRQATVQDCLQNIQSNLQGLRYFYLVVSIILSWILLPIKVHIMSAIVTLSVTQLHYQLPAKPTLEQSAEALHILVFIGVMFTLGLILFEVIDFVATYALFVGAFVYVHSCTHQMQSAEDGEARFQTKSFETTKSQSGLVGPVTTFV